MPAARVGPLLKSTGATRIQGLLSIAVLQQHSILDLHTAEALHQSGDSTVDAADPRHKVAAPNHSIQHTPPAIAALPVSAVQAPRSEHTAVHASLTRMRENFLHKRISTPPHT